MHSELAGWRRTAECAACGGHQAAWNELDTSGQHCLLIKAADHTAVAHL